MVVYETFKLKVKDMGSEKCVKGEAIPVEAWTRPEGSSRFRLPDFKTVGT
jgi:hypothetical protein